jgi:hypothetical protein
MMFVRALTFMTVACGWIAPATAQSEAETQLRRYFDNTDGITIDFDATQLGAPGAANCRFAQELRQRGSSLAFCLISRDGKRWVKHECRNMFIDNRDHGAVGIFGDQVTFRTAWATWGGMSCTYRMRLQGRELVGSMSCVGNQSSGCPPGIAGAAVPIRMQFR